MSKTLPSFIVRQQVLIIIYFSFPGKIELPISADETVNIVFKLECRKPSKR